MRREVWKQMHEKRLPVHLVRPAGTTNPRTLPPGTLFPIECHRYEIDPDRLLLRWREHCTREAKP